MNRFDFTEDYRDALQEVSNVAMGEAGAKFAQLLGSFVRLSIPRIQLAEVSNVPQAVGALLGANTMISAVRQSFFQRSTVKRSYCSAKPAAPNWRR